jgi:hypothetical protein
MHNPPITLDVIKIKALKVRSGLSMLWAILVTRLMVEVENKVHVFAYRFYKLFCCICLLCGVEDGDDIRWV